MRTMLPLVLLALAGPRWTVDEARKDAGPVWRGEKAVYRFAVRNAGDAPLMLNVHPACGCTVVNAPPSIPAGQSAAIEVVLGTNQFGGPIEKNLEVETNDSANPFVSLSVAADVRADTRILPSDRLSIDLPDDRPATRRLEVRFLRPIRLLSAVSDDRFVTAKLDPGSVTLTFASATPPGERTATVALLTSSPSDPRRTILLKVRKGICVSPASTYLGRLSLKASAGSTPVLLERASGPFRVLSVHCRDPRLSVGVATPGRRMRHLLQLRYRGGWPEGLVRRTVVVSTDVPRQRRLLVPVSAFVGD